MMKTALLAATVGGMLIGIPGVASATPLAPSATTLTGGQATKVTFWRGCDRGASGYTSGFYDQGYSGYYSPGYSGYYGGGYGDGFYGYSGFYDSPFVGNRRGWRNRGARHRSWRRNRPSVGVGVTF